MESKIDGSPTFSHIHVDLEPGESIVTESDAMSSMAAEMDVDARFNGGLFSGLIKKVLGGESLFVNEFSNRTQKPLRVTLVQHMPGEIRQVELDGESICLQPGAYVCSTPGIRLGVQYAGLGSFVGREGLFKLIVSGKGTLWYGAYGGLLDKDIDGEYIVDTSHLVAYDPQIKLKVQLAGGLFSSIFGGEGLVTRVEGKGRIVVQTRSMGGLAGWLNPRL
jgi:uncharacterized protein (TIGR00266 family)